MLMHASSTLNAHFRAVLALQNGDRVARSGTGHLVTIRQPSFTVAPIPHADDRAAEPMFQPEDAAGRGTVGHKEERLRSSQG